MKKSILIFLAVFLLLGGIVRSEEVKDNGFIESEFSLSQFKSNGKKEFGNITRLRLKMTNQFDGEKVALTTIVEYQGYMGSQYIFDRNGNQKNANFLLDRCYLDLALKKGSLRLGRQVIDWGTGNFWNPTDIFNIYVNPSFLDKDERQGIDAIWTNVPLGKSPSSLVMVYSAGNKFYANPRSAVKFKTKAGNFDLSSMYATLGKRGDYMLGFDCSGEVFKAKLYTEGGYFVSSTQKKKWLSYVIGTNIPLKNDINFNLEYYYNGYGQKNPSLYQWEQLEKGELFNLGRNYWAFGANKKVSQALSVSAAFYFNLNDNSSFLQPMLTYTLSEKTSLYIGINYFTGGKKSEYGQWDNYLFVNVRSNF